tara:strand:- start:14156 stop:14323 length:168 start_codon:yes stop_codon:yes gene_type:complete
MRSFRVIMKCMTEGCDNEVMMMSIHGWCEKCYEKWREGYAAAYSKKTYSWEGEEE